MEVDWKHFAPIARVEGTAQSIAGWVGEQVMLWGKKERQVESEWEKNDMARKQSVDPEVQKTLKKLDGEPWPEGEGVSRRGSSRL